MAPGGRYGLAAEGISRESKPGDTLVELGCGAGETLLVLSRKTSFGKVVGVDVAIRDPIEVNGIQMRNDNLNERWDFADGSIDHLIAMMVFEHLFDPFHCFQEVRRVLSPVGTAYINVPLVTSLPNRLRLLIGQLPETSVSYDRWFQDRVWDGNHIHYFSMDSLYRLAKACDLQIVTVQGVGRGWKIKSAFPSLLAGEVTFALKTAGQAKG